MTTGFINAVPFAVGVVGMIWWGRHSDKHGERREHVALAALVAGGGIAASTLIGDPTGKMIAISVAGFGIFAALPVFWTLPTAFLAGPAAAGGIAAINSIGNLSGFAGPYVMGIIKDSTGSFTIGLLVIAAVVFLAMLVALSIHHDETLERLPGEAPAE